MRILILAFAVSLVMSVACNNKAKHPPGGPYYFQGWDGYHIPFRPVKEITANQAKALKAYYVAYFDSDGKIISFTKYLYGKFDYGDNYIYDAKGSLERREMTKYTGETIIQYWNKNERLLRNDTIQTDSALIVKCINVKGELFEEHIYKPNIAKSESLK